MKPFPWLGGAVLALLVAAVAGIAHADDLRFGMPIDCTIGEDCYLQQYVDHDPGGGYRDYRCGPLSYNGHKGTDFRLKDIPTMERGVRVLAAAPGTVVATRDGLPDVNVKLIGANIVRDRGLGNAVVLDHGNGWRSYYGHMRRGSIAVKPGDRVQAGQTLGLVGMSGLTEFPHLDFAIRHRDAVVDPFVGLSTAKGCGATGTPLWMDAVAQRLEYRPTFVMAAGFSDRELNREALSYGYDKDSIRAKSRNLLFFIDIAGLRKGDAYALRIVGPDGKTAFEKTDTLDRDAAVRFLGGGAENRKQPWPRGTYRAEFRLMRTENGKTATVLNVERKVEVR